MSDLSGLSRLIGDAGSGEGDLSGLERDLSGGYQDLGSGSRLGGDAPPEESGGTTPGGPCGGAYSFSPDTAVATPHGQQSIGSLKVGDQVEAYNPTTGKPEAEPIQTIWVNHDHDLVDVHLAPASSSSSAATPVSLRTSDTSGHGRIIGDDAATTTVRLATPSTTNVAPGGETIYTTANHPWLTADRGWVEAGQLQVGEPVVTLNGATGTVVWVYTVPGQADMYNLTVAHDHAYAVGGGQWVVHNTCIGDKLPAYEGGKTQGILDTGSGEPIDLKSGEWGPSRNMHYNAPDTPVIGKNSNSQLWTHVEGQAAAIMREQGLDQATLWINNAPCERGGTGCAYFLPHMLPEGATLTVNVKDVEVPGGWKTQTYTGSPDSAWPPSNWPPGRG